MSQAELVVMQIIWDLGSATANQVIDALPKGIGWKPKTAQTLLARLVQKRALRFEKIRREYLFHPLIDRRDYVVSEARSFLQRFFNGEVAPFLSCLLENEELSKEEVAELRRILESKPRSRS